MRPGSVNTKALLRDVSRSFYLTLRMLPHAMRPQLSVAYLLARASDAVADTQLVDLNRRVEALRQMRECMHQACEGLPGQLPEFGAFSKAQADVAGEGNAAERELLENWQVVLASLRAFEVEDRVRIVRLLDTITAAQEADLVRFGPASADRIVALQDDAELDRYTYAVAGCVGEFWTEMCCAHVLTVSPERQRELVADGVLFGKGLQLVNILRDLPRDLRQGRCYLPADRLSERGLDPASLLNSDALDAFRPLYDEYIARAEAHLSSGWRYTTSLPFWPIWSLDAARLRLACAWPALIGIATLRLLRRGNPLDATRRIKVGRGAVRRLILMSILLYLRPNAWRRLFEAAGKE